MEDLIKALQIFLKYGNPTFPTHCEHDELRIMIDPELVSADDTEKLDHLGFTPDADIGNCFISYKYGSA